MAQFRGTVEGQRGEASRLGSKSSGLTVTANGWNIGVRVFVEHIDGRDVIHVQQTGGSNNRSPIKTIATIIDQEG